MKTRTLTVLLILALAAPYWAAAPARADTWVFDTVEDLSSYCFGTSLALDGAGYPHVAYYDYGQGDLKYAYWDGAGWQRETIDSAGAVGTYPSLELDGSGSPHVAYLDVTNGDIKYAYRDGSGWHPEFVAHADSYGGQISLALDGSDVPHISYNEQIDSYEVQYATKNGGTWTTELIKVVSGFGGHTSIAIDSLDQPHVAFSDKKNILHGYRDGSGWHTEQAVTTGWYGGFLSLALDSSDWPHISYYDDSGDALKYVYWDGSQWVPQTLPDIQITGDSGYSSLALDSADHPHIAFYDDIGSSVRYVFHDGSEWQSETIASAGNEEISGGYVSLELDDGGQPHVSYADGVATAVKYAYRMAGPPPTPRYVDPAGACGGQSPCYTTIGAAVAASNDGDTIHIYPGTYPESVNLGAMALSGGLTLLTVDAARVPAAGTVTVSPAAGPAFYTSPALGGDLHLYGFVVGSPDDAAILVTVNGDVTIDHVTVTGAGDDGVNVDAAGGSITVRDSVSSGNPQDGFELVASGTTTIERCTADDNDDMGFDVTAGGLVTIEDATANNSYRAGVDVVTGGALVIANVTANGGRSGSDGDGFHLAANGSVTISQATARGNAQAGIDLGYVGAITLQNCDVEDNGAPGLELDAPDGNSTVHGGILCGNAHGLDLNANVAVNAEGNWWGCAAGPGAAGCDVAQATAGSIDVDPWIDTVSITTTVDPVNAGQPAVIRFQFSGGAGTAFLGLGPGDLHGTPPFRLTTDNGRLTDSDETGVTVTEFVNRPDGVLEVTLTPFCGGTAAVTLAGPCGLAGSITVDVIGPTCQQFYLPLVFRH